MYINELNLLLRKYSIAHFEFFFLNEIGSSLKEQMVSHSRVSHLFVKKNFFVFQALIILCKNCLRQQSEYCVNGCWTYS